MSSERPGRFAGLMGGNVADAGEKASVAERLLPERGGVRVTASAEGVMCCGTNETAVELRLGEDERARCARACCKRSAVVLCDLD